MVGKAFHSGSRLLRLAHLIMRLENKFNENTTIENTFWQHDSFLKQNMKHCHDFYQAMKPPLKTKHSDCRTSTALLSEVAALQYVAPRYFRQPRSTGSLRVKGEACALSYVDGSRKS